MPALVGEAVGGVGGRVGTKGALVAFRIEGEMVGTVGVRETSVGACVSEIQEKRHHQHLVFR